MSNVGTWMQTVALGILVFARTGQPAWTGLVAAAGFIPIGLLAPLGGALADRLDRRRWLIVTTLAEMSFAAILAVLAAVGHDPPGVLVLFSFLGGASGAIGFPAYQAMVPDLVPQDDLLGAVSLSSAQFNLGRVLGPALAGLALLSHDYAVVFGINAASFAAVVVALTLVRLPKPINAGGTVGIWPRIVIGARAAMSEPGCRAAIGAHRHRRPVGLAVHRPGAGHVRGAAPSRRQHSGGHRPAGHRPGDRGGGRCPCPSVPGRAVRPAGHAPDGSLFVLPLLLVAYGLAPTLWWSVVAFLAVGAGYIAVLSGLNTVVQLRAPAEVRGRILGIYMVGLGIVYPIGAVLQGWIGDHIGVRAVTVLGAVILFVVMAVIAAVRPVVFIALGDPTSPSQHGAYPPPELP